jgi:GWxTD domain-containing protein
MKTRNLLIGAAAVFAFAVSGFAALSPAKADWAKGPVQFIMTPQEQAQWKSLQSDADADAFIALFWARRDPTPGTARNEFKEDFDARVAAADANFAGRKVKGSLTDRGRILVVFGTPTRVAHSGGRGASAASPSAAASEGMSDTADPTERFRWNWEGDAAMKAFGMQRAELNFIDRLSNGDFLLQSAGFDLNGAIQRHNAASITQPNLTSAPSAQTAQAAPVPAAPAAAPQPVAVQTTLKTAAFESAVTEAKAAKSAGKGVLTYAELVSPIGEYYVPVTFYLPASAGVAADAADTIFGVVEDASGARVLAFEEPTKPETSKGDVYVDKTLAVTPASGGKYTAIIGVAKGGVPVAVSSGTLNLSPLTKDAVGVSRLILSGDIHETTEAAPVKAPFAFGKLKIVPRGSLTFGNQEELNYFVEINNPGIDSATNMPKLQTKVDLVMPDKKTVSAPLADAPALPLSGKDGPGHYAIISSIPLNELKPALKAGDYTLRIKVVDTVTKQSYTVDQTFKITG